MRRARPPAVAPLALALLAALRPVAAQQAVERADRIEVTGSRIATSSDSDSASPVAIIRADEIRMDGFSSLELILNSLPQLVGDQGNRVSNGASGTATAEMYTIAYTLSLHDALPISACCAATGRRAASKASTSGATAGGRALLIVMTLSNAIHS